MASANWMKATTQKAGAMKKHLGQKEREQGNHSNKDIDRSLSKRNYTVGCRSYAEALERMKRRTAEVDKLIPPKRIRKDRVTCCFIEIPCPLTLTERGKSDAFFHSAYQTLSEFFGSENVHGGFVHKDEVHTYTDKDKTRRTSLEHVHVLVSAYTPEKGINGKAFETKARLKALNEELDDMCIRSFGVRLNTKETPQRKSVERLKEETELRKEAERLEQRLELIKIGYGEEHERLEKARSEAKQSVQEAERKVKEAENKLNELKEASSSEIFSKVGAIRNIAEKLSHGEKKLTKKEQETVMNVAANIGQIEAEYTKLKEDLQKQQDTLAEKQRTLDFKIHNEQTLIKQEANYLAEKLSKEAVRKAEALQYDAEHKLYDMKQEREKEINEALKPYKQRIAKARQEIEYVRDVCEFATDEPFEVTERRYKRRIADIESQSRGGMER